MIPNQNTGLDVKSNMPGVRSGQFSVDTASMGHIMSVLTNIYSDDEAATIREYITNASDSHIASGQTRPVEVCTPGRFNGVFTIQDFGVGMSADDIVETYAKYGKSTKRGSNDETGMFGIGSKSALTYTNSFTVVAVKNGMKASVLISMNTKGVPEYNIIANEPTTEPNGVLISIPAKKDNNFDAKTESFLQYWPKGSVLLNGQEPKRLEDKGFRMVKKGLWINDKQSGHATTRTLVMGGVPYKVEGHHLSGLSRENLFSWVIDVPVGSVEITPSREALNYSEATVKVLNERTKELNELYFEEVIKYLDSLDTPWDQWVAYHALPYGLSQRDRRLADYTVKGIKVRLLDRIPLAAPLRDPNAPSNLHIVVGYEAWISHGKWKVREIQNLQLDQIKRDQNFTIVYGDKAIEKKPGAPMKRKMDKYAADNSKARRFIFTLRKIDHEFFPDTITQVKFEEIDAIVAPLNRGGAPRPKEIPFDFAFRDGVDQYNRVKLTWDSAVTIPGKKIYYLSLAELKPYSTRNSSVSLTTVINHFPTGVKIATLTRGQVERFKRLNPNAKHVTEGYADLFADLASVAETKYDMSEGASARAVQSLPVERIKDKALVKEILDARKVGGSATCAQRQKISDIRGTFRSVELSVPLVEPKAKRLENLHRYPLAVRVGDHPDLVGYINDKYEREYK